jgi:predicted O-methyltransferase YrrM
MIPPTSQNPREFEELLKIYKKEKPLKVLEIGSHEGGTLYYWLKYAQKNALVASIDNQRINDEHYDSWKSDPSVTCIYLTDKSQELSSWDWADKHLFPLDWLFIDGGHSYDEVSTDFNMYSSLVRDYGVVAFHDILSYPPYNSEVSKFWDEIKVDYDYDEIIYPPPHGEWEKGPGIGVIYV